MKKFLPKTSNNSKGFTLIELLVVISIIAILAIVGIALFSGTQAKARDAKRQEDILAISKAFEVQKVAGTNTYPQTASSWFAGNTIPTESSTDRNYIIVYTITAGASTVGKPTTWTAAATPVNPTVAGATVATLATGIPASGSITAFQICALLETGSNPGNIFCVPNSQ